MTEILGEDLEVLVELGDGEAGEGVDTVRVLFVGKLQRENIGE